MPNSTENHWSLLALRLTFAFVERFLFFNLASQLVSALRACCLFRLSSQITSFFLLASLFLFFLLESLFSFFSLESLFSFSCNPICILAAAFSTTAAKGMQILVCKLFNINLYLTDKVRDQVTRHFFGLEFLVASSRRGEISRSHWIECHGAYFESKTVK